MAKIVFPAKYLAEAALFISKEETRYYLNGVSARVVADCLILVTTDGHRMGVFQPTPAAYTPDFAALAPPILGLRNRGKIVLDMARSKPTSFKAMGKFIVWAVYDTDGEGTLSFYEGPDSQEAADGFASGNPKHFSELIASFGRRRIDGTYPDWTRVIPSRFVDASHSTFQAQYLMDFGSLRSGRRERPQIEVYAAADKDGKPDPTSPHLVRVPGRDDFFGIIMPMRSGGTAGFPKWFRHFGGEPLAALPPVEPVSTAVSATPAAEPVAAQAAE